MAGLRLAGQLGVGRCCNQAFALRTQIVSDMAIFRQLTPPLPATRLGALDPAKT